MCKLHIFATTKIHAALAKSDSHCLVSFNRRFNLFFTKLVIMASEKCPPFSEYIHAVIWQLNSIRQVEDKYCTSKLQQAVTVNIGVNRS